MHIRDIGGNSEMPATSEIPTSPDQLLGELGLGTETIREILDDVSSEPALDLRPEG